MLLVSAKHLWFLLACHTCHPSVGNGRNFPHHWRSLPAAAEQKSNSVLCICSGDNWQRAIPSLSLPSLTLSSSSQQQLNCLYVGWLRPRDTVRARGPVTDIQVRQYTDYRIGKRPTIPEPEAVVTMQRTWNLEKVVYGHQWPELLLERQQLLTLPRNSPLLWLGTVFTKTNHCILSQAEPNLVHSLLNPICLQRSACAFRLYLGLPCCLFSLQDSWPKFCMQFAHHHSYYLAWYTRNMTNYSIFILLWPPVFPETKFRTHTYTSDYTGKPTTPSP